MKLKVIKFHVMEQYIMRIDNNHRNNQYYRDTKLLATSYTIMSIIVLWVGDIKGLSVLLFPYFMAPCCICPTSRKYSTLGQI